MGWGVFQYPQKESLTDTMPTTMQPTTTITKKETNIWFPFDSSDIYTPPASANRDLLDKSPILSPFATPPLPSQSHEKKTSFTSSSCRYYSMADKHDLFSSYANIVSEAATSRTSGIPFSPMSDGPSPITHHHSQAHQAQTNGLPTNPSQSNCGGIFGPPYSPMSPYPLLQGMSYEAVAAGNARCALPSPTIFPPTPPPSAPWNPWGGF